ncbi:Phage tail fibre repeat-containing protein [Candidatus Pantoea symbiotica]|uniref:Phage tail fibre repeat-containing protein n=1 Tax=Candidatus Pantoea symbiotica TaxID=1884370 RepID=A0A1I3UWN2_9GAMM|nr:MULTISPECIES: phage tail protein [Pantoea]SFJ87588.1 Phage tail fibre repeat-containing protein [Pantoea symbiotica]SFU61576.1 Phage tail fibre repeat-containing protein [Pantoea sp. YR525]
MTTKYFALLTNQGAALLANAAALGTKVNITSMAVGDGGGTLPTPDPAQTKLIGEKRRAQLNSLTIDDANSSQIVAEQIIPEGEGGFWIREIGLYDEGGILIAVANCAETYKPLLAEGSGRTQTVRMIIIVNSTTAVTLKIDPAVVLATRQYVDNAVIEVKAYSDNLMAQHIADADPHKQYAPKASPTLTGIPKAPTPAVTKNDTQIATTAFVQAAFKALLSSDTDSNSEVLAATPKAVSDAIALIKGLMGTAAGRAVGTGANQIPDMSSFAATMNGSNFYVEFPNGFTVQGGTLSLTPVGAFNPQALGGQTYYTHYYRVPFIKAFKTAQVTTLAALTSPSYDTQGSMAGRSLAVHRDQDPGVSGVAKTRFSLAVTHPVTGETPTVHWVAYGY